MPSRGHRDIFARDITWHPGNGPGIHYARFLMDEGDTASPLVILTRFDPGAHVEPHSHGTNYCEYVIEGEQTVGKVTFGKGDMRFAKAGAGYGPITIGPDGCTVMIVFQNAAGANTVAVGKAKALAVAEAIADADL